jgi:hypothetical protein
MLVTTSGPDTSAQPFAGEIKPPPASPLPGAQGGDPPAASTDSVSLSPAAQQVLAGQPAADGPAAPNSEALKQAADLLNDTTGAVSVADQVSAFALITGFVANGKNFDASKDPASVIAAGAALYDSAFAQRQRLLLDAVNSRMLDAKNQATATSLQDGLAMFDAFSARDQEIYLGAINLQAQTAPGASASAPAFASPDSYRANLQAQVGVHSAVEAVGGTATGPLAALYGSAPGSDAWTLKAQAYFAQFGPPPPPNPRAPHVSTPAGAAPPTGAALMAALRVVNDSGGRMAVKDQLAAYDLLTTYSSASKDQGPARDAVVQSFEASPFALHVAQVHTLMNIPVFSSDVGQVLLDRLNRLTPDDQQIAFHDQSKTAPGAFASLDGLKANDLARSAVQKVIGKIFAKFGGDDLTKLADPRLVRNPAFKALLKLASQNQASDAWTAQSKKVLDDLAKSLDLTPDDPRAKDAAKALATLKAPPPVNVGTASAMKTLKHIHDDLQKVRDDNAADRAGQAHKGGKQLKPKTDDKTDPPTAKPAPLQVLYAPGETVNTYA